MSVRTLLPLLFTGFLLVGCATEEDASALVNEADELLVNGGIEVAEKREIAVRNYDRAIRIICGEGSGECKGSGSAATPGTEAYNLSHAHFGLGMARIFNLVDRIEQLYSGDLLGRNLLLDEDGDEDIDLDSECQSHANMDFLVPLLSSIINTSLLPIIDDLQKVTDYPEFSITYYQGFLDLSFLGDDEQGRIGFFVGASPVNNVNEPGVFGVPEVHAMLGVLRLVTAGAQVVFSYNDLTQALLTFGPMLNINRNDSPYKFARVLNTHPCEPNPLLDPEFGVLTRQGNESLALARKQLEALFAEQQVGFNAIAERGSTDALLNYSGNSGDAWADNLFSRIRVGGSTEERELTTVGKLLTQNVGPEDAGEVFARLAGSLQGDVVFDPIGFVQEPEQASLRQLLEWIGFEDLGIPAFRLGNLFDNPISDLKAVAPLTYVQSEPYSTGRSDFEHPRQMLDHEKPLGTRSGQDLFYDDANGDQNWNQRGDFIIQTERETFIDSNDNYTPAPPFHGILGTFWDLTGNGRPDPVYQDWQSSEEVTTVTIPWHEEQSVMAVTDSTAPTGYVLAVTDATGTHYQEDTCLLGDVEDCEGLRVGEVLGHMWPPSRVPERYPSPEEFTGRTDPANGSMDMIYLFFPNPSLNGALVLPRDAEDRAAGYRDLENHELNAFFNSIFYDNLVGRLAAR